MQLVLSEVVKYFKQPVRIEKVLRTRTPPDNTTKLFIRSVGWPDKYNSWIQQTDKYDVVDE